MDQTKSIQNTEAGDRLWANYMITNLLPANHGSVLHGIAALEQIHKAANKMVLDDAKRLEDTLESPHTLRTYVLALIAEAVEFIQEFDWKPWRHKNKVEDGAKILDEFADILAFVGVIITILTARGFTPEEIADAYIKKEKTNISRFIDAVYKE